MLFKKVKLFALSKLLKATTRCKSWLNYDFVKVKPNVKTAIMCGNPVVALESTIITHGMPYPQNFNTAKKVENIVEESGAIPATIAIIDGQIHVGTTIKQLQLIASCKNSHKLSKLDIGTAINERVTGGTTVSATMMIAERCGIRVFVTGGIGGVHRGAEESFDISSDLTELGKTSVHVVCSGVKSILDIPKTLEYLETQSVPVFTYGESKVFPAFFTRKSGCSVKMNFKDAKQAAEFIKTTDKLKVENGSVIAVPIPQEYENIGKDVESAIHLALKKAKECNISGAAVTPFVLSKVNDLTKGSSLKANIGLIKNNAKVGAEIAVAYSNLKRGRNEITSSDIKSRKPPVVIGACCIDFMSKCREEVVFYGPSNPVDITLSAGGVGKNVFEGLHRLGSKPKFLSVIGEDANGVFLKNFLKDMDLSMVETIPGSSTGIYSVAFSLSGDVVIGFQDMKINDRFTTDIIKQHEEELLQAPLICLDGNLPKSTSQYVCNLCKKNSIPLLFEPTEALKAAALSCSLDGITYATPNIMELEVMAAKLSNTNQSTNIDFTKSSLDMKDLQSVIELCRIFSGRVKHMIVSLGKFGAIWVTLTDEKDTMKSKYYSLDNLPRWKFMNEPVANVSGSGDSFTSAFVHSIVNGENTNSAIKFGLVAAQHTVRSKYPIARTIDENLFDKYPLDTWEPIDVC